MPELLGLRPAVLPGHTIQRPVLDWAHLLRTDDLGWEYVHGTTGPDYPHAEVWVTDRLVLKHGSVARKGSGNSPRAALERKTYATLHGHTHRKATVYQTIWARENGQPKPLTIQGGEAGCLCEQPNYIEEPDWQPGFCTVRAYTTGETQIEHADYNPTTNELTWQGRKWGL